MIKEKKILMSNKEVDRNHLWLRPRLSGDGFDLLYYGVRGWTLLINDEKEVKECSEIYTPD